MKSSNGKVGPIPVSTSSAMTCPNACPLREKGCYAKSGPLNLHWAKVTSGERGSSVDTFAASIASLPAGTLWRHNQAGDLAGIGDTIDTVALASLVEANNGRRGFTYTHKPVSGDTAIATANRAAIARANVDGFTINFSADTLSEADELSDLGVGPVVVVLDAVEGIRGDTVTPAGRKVSTCPATYRDNVTCQSCQLCQRRDRKVIVGFPAHGNGRKSALAAVRSL
jgi:hypothetical protein